ncbi:MAG: hypothetical protein JST55_10125 [Bacteroidetes bacterium]|nr:hypothetical protein [Bacteroidota bacterium]
MSINIYKNWDPSKGDFVNDDLEMERIQRKKDRLKTRIQLIIFGVIFVGLLVFSFWYAYKVRR